MSFIPPQDGFQESSHHEDSYPKNNRYQRSEPVERRPRSVSRARPDERTRAYSRSGSPRGRGRRPSPVYRGRSPSRDGYRRSFRGPRPEFPGRREERREYNHRPSFRDRENPAPSNVLGVFGMSKKTTERDIEEVFGEFGRVEKVALVYEKEYNESRGFGFITFESEAQATAALQKMNGADLDGQKIRVDYSTTQRPHEPTPGMYMGKTMRRPPHRSYRSRSRSRSRYEQRTSHHTRSRSRSRPLKVYK